MAGQARIAVLGLYNSGSTALAGMLYRLGVNMGPPFWMSSDDASDVNFYEPYDLSWHLRRWWDEPRAVAQVPAAVRIQFLERWVALQECNSTCPIGAKHPLLSMCGPDIVAAWGKDVRLIWSWRSLDESVAGLLRRNWFKHDEIPPLQQKLWDAVHEFERSHPGVVRIEWPRVKKDPAWAARELASLAGLQPSDAQIQAAIDFVRPVPHKKRPWWRFWKKRHSSMTGSV